MTTAQPGQEQRMENPFDESVEHELAHAMDNYEGDPDDNGALNRLANNCVTIGYEFALRTRPTADLGEDGELVERLRENALDMEAHGFPIYARPLNEAADRLILYREALVAARPYVEANASRDSRMTAHHKGADVLDKIDAVLSRSGG